MTELLRFWRTVPRLLVGILIAGELFAISRGGAAFQELSMVLSKTRALLGEGTNGVFLAIAVAAIAAAASEIVRAALLPLTFVVGKLARGLAARFTGGIADALSVLGSTPAQVASHMFEQNEQLVHGVYRGSSLAAATTPDQYALIEAKYDGQFAMIRDSIRRLANTREELWRLAYFGNVAQEQAFADFTESVVESIQVGWIAFLLLPFAAARLPVDHSNVVLITVLGGFAVVLSVPTFIRKKLTLATYLVHSFVMIIQFGRLAETSESDMLVH
jgi:hypothetical protein